MAVNLSKELEQIVQDAVRAGLYAREDDVIRDALLQLKQALPQHPAMSSRTPSCAKVTPQQMPPLSPDELNQRLLAAGLVTRLPDPAEDIGDDDEPPHRDPRGTTLGNHHP